MKLELLIHQVETRLFNLGNTLLQGGAKADLQEDLEHAQVELAARKGAAARAVARREEIRKRIQANKEQADALPPQIESSFRRGKAAQALRQALELESLRRSISADESELPKLDQTIWSLSFNLRQMERRLARIREQIGDL
jgi:predicted  nucleic acid-binding Zn-ribbon protein